MSPHLGCFFSLSLSFPIRRWKLFSLTPRVEIRIHQKGAARGGELCKGLAAPRLGGNYHSSASPFCFPKEMGLTAHWGTCVSSKWAPLCSQSPGSSCPEKSAECSNQQEDSGGLQDTGSPGMGVSRTGWPTVTHWTPFISGSVFLPVKLN
jgi:hypothetical protein